VDILHLEKIKLENSSLVQRDIGTKRRINEVVIGYTINMNGVSTKDDI
jgi:hypothetical protein